MRAYEYVHIVGFEETNLTGNVYYANHIRWQGRCREMFLRDHAPSVLKEMNHGLVLVTVRCACEYLAELAPFDEVVLRMRLHALVQNRIALKFDYVRRTAVGGAEVVARGEQEIACMRRSVDELTPELIPAELRQALVPYGHP